MTIDNETVETNIQEAPTMTFFAVAFVVLAVLLTIGHPDSGWIFVLASIFIFTGAFAFASAVRLLIEAITESLSPPYSVTCKISGMEDKEQKLLVSDGSTIIIKAPEDGQPLSAWLIYSIE